MITRNFSAQKGLVVYVAENWPCPCGRQVQAYDVHNDGAEITVICSGCHRDLLQIKKAGI